LVPTILNTFSSRLLITLFNFLIVIGISRILGPDGKGQATLIITSIFMILFFCNIMSGRALIYLIPRYKPSSLIIPAYLWCLVISIIAWGLMHITPWLNSAFVPHVFLLSLLYGLLHTHLMVLAGKERIYFHNTLNVLQVALTLIGLALSFYVVGYRSIFAYIYSLYGSFLLTLLVSFGAIYPYWRAMSFTSTKNRIRESVSFGSHYQFYEIMQLLNFRFAFYVLDAWHGEDVLGIYSIGVSLLEAAWLFGRSVSFVQYTRIANYKDALATRLLTLRLAKMSLIISGIGIFVLLIMPKSLYTFIFGEAFGNIKDYMKWLMPGILVYSPALAVTNYFAGLGRYRVNIAGAFLGFICTLLFSYTLIPNFAMSGAGLTATISFTVTTAFLLWQFQRRAAFAIADYIPKWHDVTILKQELTKVLKGARYKQ